MLASWPSRGTQWRNGRFHQALVLARDRRSPVSSRMVLILNEFTVPVILPSSSTVPGRAGSPESGKMGDDFHAADLVPITGFGDQGP